MNSTSIQRPETGEYRVYYAGYVARVPDGDLVSLLRQQLTETVALLRRAPPERLDFAYAPGKWTVKEVVGHLSDVERVMAYRALSFARGDAAELPAFDEGAWVQRAGFGTQNLDELVDELEVVRAATIQLAAHLDAATLARGGTASGNFVTVRALFYIIAGHELHHADLLRERYMLR